MNHHDQLSVLTIPEYVQDTIKESGYDNRLTRQFNMIQDEYSDMQ